MRDGAPSVQYLRDYRKPVYRIDTIDLVFDLHEEYATVTATSAICRTTAADNGKGDAAAPLVLDGEGLVLKSVMVDGVPWPEDRYSLDQISLTLSGVPREFELVIVTEIYPHKNTSLEGLYKTSTMFCTQCEAQGFRKITYFLDRPDNMSIYSCKVIASKTSYPVLLSNGDLIEAGEVAGNRHWALWHDPYRKPSYLFALVAGNLRCLEGSHVTSSGRRVDLRIYVEPENIDKCEHAMASLKKAMCWDEEKYGLEYDLVTYMIVAVNDFNMGAMENKGLNIFNSKYVLANPETATDDDYTGIESVIGHEYFHNWTGNRVTCRDWFQLSLKEGLTVFRDQEFSADVFSRAVMRIRDVRVLRNTQFVEDAGPMAHPVRPESYIEINNFYTTTIYNKGAEIVRMYQVLFGEHGFRKGLEHYLHKFDGQAVTTDDFFSSMMSANNAHYDQFKLWYSQAGTPEVMVEADYNQMAQTYTIRLKQTCQPTPEQKEKQPFLIPVAIGLLDEHGNDIPLSLDKGSQDNSDFFPGTQVLKLDAEEKSFAFENISVKPVPSLLRGFSAPVRLNYDYTHEELALLSQYDTDPFNRWESFQRLAMERILALVGCVDEYGVLHGEGEDGADYLVSSFEILLTAPGLDRALVAEALLLPSETMLAETMDPIQIDKIHYAREYVKRTLAQAMRPLLLQTYLDNHDAENYSYNSVSAGKRSLKNVCLSYLLHQHDDEAYGHALKQFHEAGNMTDVLAALDSIVNSASPHRSEVLEAFYRRWHHDPLVMDKWLSLQARSKMAGALERVKQLMLDPVFDIRNPNKVRSLIGAFVSANQVQFHAVSGSGYEFLKQQVIALDKTNSQIAARLMSAFTRWRRYDEHRQGLMKEQIAEIMSLPGLSKDCYEIASKCLSDEPE